MNLQTTTQNKTNTMSSTQLAEIIKFESKSSLNKKVRVMFQSKIDDSTIKSSLDSRGYVTDYHLPELESKMFVAKHDIEYLEIITTYWIKQSKPALLTQEQQVLAIAHQLIETTKQRDEAIKSKAYINDKRTATLMNKASQDSKKIKRLESQLQDTGSHKSLIAAKLPQRIDTELKPNVQTWRILKQISDKLKHDIIKVKDARYGEVNTYHIDVINSFKEGYL